jgi:phage terminase small subunit
MNEQKLQAVKDHFLFAQLTPKQQAFVVTFVTSEDLVGSVRTAGYNPKNDHSADMMARKMLVHPSIKQLVAMGLGYDTSGGILSKNELLLRLSDHIRKAKSASVFSKLVGQFTELRGWSNKEVPDVNAAALAIERQRRKQKEQTK